MKIMDFLIGAVAGAGVTYAYTQGWLNSLIALIPGQSSAYTYAYRY